MQLVSNEKKYLGNVYFKVKYGAHRYMHKQELQVKKYSLSDMCLLRTEFPTDIGMILTADPTWKDGLSVAAWKENPSTLQFFFIS